MQQQSIRSLALRCLSSPTGLTFGRDEKLLYVCETGRNRILRFYESKEGVYYMSVFHQFSGRFGPTSIVATAQGLIITGLFEFRGLAEEGSLGFLNEEGELLQRLKLPQFGP
jgi:sugar lactone lactonase YvrE